MSRVRRHRGRRDRAGRPCDIAISAYKTAEAHWTRTFEWTIEKSVSPDSWNLETGQPGTSTYTVKVTKSAGTNAIWVDGKVCVENVSTMPTENLKVVDRLRAPSTAR